MSFKTSDLACMLFSFLPFLTAFEILDVSQMLLTRFDLSQTYIKGGNCTFAIILHFKCNIYINKNTFPNILTIAYESFNYLC